MSDAPSSTLCSLEAQQESGGVCSVLHVSGSTRCLTLLPLQPNSCHDCVAVWLKNFRSCFSLWEGKIPHHLNTHAKIKVPRTKETQTRCIGAGQRGTPDTQGGGVLGVCL